MRLVRKDAARAAAAGDGFDEAVDAGGDLAAAAEQAELEELRRLEAMLAHEEEMRRSDLGVPSCCGVFTSLIRLVSISLP